MIYWEAFQFIGLPVELEGTKYPGSQAGRVPSRCRVLLCGTFRNQAVEERAKADVGAWRKQLKTRLATYELMPDDPMETMPVSQVGDRWVVSYIYPYSQSSIHISESSQVPSMPSSPHALLRQYIVASFQMVVQSLPAMKVTTMMIQFTF